RSTAGRPGAAGRDREDRAARYSGRMGSGGCVRPGAHPVGKPASWNGVLCLLGAGRTLAGCSGELDPEPAAAGGRGFHSLLSAYALHALSDDRQPQSSFRVGLVGMKAFERLEDPISNGQSDSISAIRIGTYPAIKARRPRLLVFLSYIMVPPPM